MHILNERGLHRDAIELGHRLLDDPALAQGWGSDETRLRGSVWMNGGICHRVAGEFAGALHRILHDREYAARLGSAARRLACDSYAWERLSPRLGRLMTRYRTAGRAPSFSVVVPPRPPR